MNGQNVGQSWTSVLKRVTNQYTTDAVHVLQIRVPRFNSGRGLQYFLENKGENLSLDV